MHQSLTQQRSSDMSLPDSMGAFNRRKRNSIYVTVTLLIVSVLILTVGLAATTRTQNVTVGGYYPGVILGFGSFLGIIGSNLIENKRQMLVASIVFISFGVIAAFCCAIVDGVFAARHIDLKPLYANRCHYVPKTSQREAEEIISTTTKLSTSAKLMKNLTQAAREVNCPQLSRGLCTPRIRGNTCFCCDLYNCGKKYFRKISEAVVGWGRSPLQPWSLRVETGGRQFQRKFAQKMDQMESWISNRRKPH